MKLAKDLIARAENDSSLLIPVVFNLSSWRSKDRNQTSEQINQYLDKAGEPLGAVKTLLNQNPELQGLAKSPLMLSILIRVYQGKKVEDLLQAVSLQRRQKIPV